jgi:Asp-tRNA(Asn)/Glu-tRNA(Gln) amidotransferase A subunit family amidase
VSGPLARNPEDLELPWKIIVGLHNSDRNIPDIDWKQPLDKSPGEYKITRTDGLPIGVQVVDKYWSEPELLHFAKKIAGLTPMFMKPDGY